MPTLTNPLEKCTGCTHTRRQHRPACACGCTVMQVEAGATPARTAKAKHAKPKAACPECGRKRVHKADCVTGMKANG